MQSSYDKVSELYLQSSAGRDFIEFLRKRLATLRLSTASWDVKGNPTDPKPYFRCTYDGAIRNGEPHEYSVWHYDDKDLTDKFEVDWDWVIQSEELVHLADRIWGTKSIPSYGCKLMRNPKGPKRQKCLQDAFPRFAYEWLTKRLAQDHKEASIRIRQAIRCWQNDPEHAVRKAALTERTAIDEIRKALLKYRHLDVSILRTAFHEFVAEDVLSC